MIETANKIIFDESEYCFERCSLNGPLTLGDYMLKAPVKIYSDIEDLTEFLDQCDTFFDTGHSPFNLEQRSIDRMILTK